MPLDARGVWIDEIRECDCGISANAELPAAPNGNAGGGELPPPKLQQVPAAMAKEFK